MSWPNDFAICSFNSLCISDDFSAKCLQVIPSSLWFGWLWPVSGSRLAYFFWGDGVPYEVQVFFKSSQISVESIAGHWTGLEQIGQSLAIFQGSIEGIFKEKLLGVMAVFGVEWVWWGRGCCCDFCFPNWTAVMGKEMLWYACIIS